MSEVYENHPITLIKDDGAIEFVIAKLLVPNGDKEKWNWPPEVHFKNDLFKFDKMGKHNRPIYREVVGEKKEVPPIQQLKEYIATQNQLIAQLTVADAKSKEAITDLQAEVKRLRTVLLNKIT